MLHTWGCASASSTCEHSLFTFYSHRCSQSIVPTSAGRKSWKHPKHSCELIFLHKHKPHTRARHAGARLPVHAAVFGTGLIYHHKAAHDSVRFEVWIQYLRYSNKGSFLHSLSGSRAVRLPRPGQQPCANTRLWTSHSLSVSHGTSQASMCSHK